MYVYLGKNGRGENTGRVGEGVDGRFDQNAYFHVWNSQTVNERLKNSCNFLASVWNSTSYMVCVDADFFVHIMHPITNRVFVISDNTLEKSRL